MSVDSGTGGDYARQMQSRPPCGGGTGVEKQGKLRGQVPHRRVRVIGPVDGDEDRGGCGDRCTGRGGEPVPVPVSAGGGGGDAKLLNPSVEHDRIGGVHWDANGLRGEGKFELSGVEGASGAGGDRQRRTGRLTGKRAEIRVEPWPLGGDA